MTGRTRIAISLGDPAGIASETTAKAIIALRESPIDFILTCEREYFDELSSRFQWAADLMEIAGTSGENVGAKIEFVGGAKYGGLVSFGNPTSSSGGFAYDSLITAIELCMAGTVDALVTAPLSKAALRMAGHDYPGHTEILREIAGVERVVMAFIAGDNRVVPLTRHIPIKVVPYSIFPELIFETITITCNWLTRYEGIAKPRVGVLALNPHGGESGIIGDEEDVILDGIATAIESGYAVSGPIVPDTAFLPEVKVAYDILIGMYHDQVLIPFKMVAFNIGVNATLGLPFIRTSPDHGTAYSIAGKDVADPGSTIAAIELAVRWAVISKG